MSELRRKYGEILLSLYLLLVQSLEGGVGVNSLRVMVPEERILVENLVESSQDHLGRGGFFASFNDIQNATRSSPLIDAVLPQVCCTKRGMFSITGSSMDYYCSDLTGEGEDWSVFWFSCPLEEKILHGESQEVCSPPSMISWPPECEKGKESTIGKVDNDYESLVSEEDADENISGEHQIQRRNKRSAVTSEVFARAYENTKMADRVAQTANATCEDIRQVENYINHLNSKNGFSLSFHAEQVYKDILETYNEGLERAKTNSEDWRKEGGVLEALNKTYILTKEFEPKFQDHFKQMKKYIEIVLEKEKLDIDELERNMIEQKRDLEETLEAIIKFINVQVKSKIKKFLETKLKDQRQKLEILTDEYERAKAEYEFQKLKELLEYVRANAEEIKNNAENTRKKIENFRENIISDSAAFDRSRESAQEGVQKLRNNKNKNNEDLRNINVEKENLVRRIRDENNRKIRLERNMEDAKNDLRRTVRRIQNQINSEWEREKLGYYLLAIPVFGWIAGGVIAGQANAAQNDLIRRKENVVDDYDRSLRSSRSTINFLENESNSKADRIRRLESEAKKLTTELQYFEEVKDDLGILKGDVETILPLIDQAIKSVNRIKEMFHAAEQELGEVIHNAEYAKTNAQKKIHRYFMTFEVDMLKLHWKNAKDKIISLGKCVSN